jgi:hypothetical protein
MIPFHLRKCVSQDNTSGAYPIRATVPLENMLLQSLPNYNAKRLKKLTLSSSNLKEI